MTRQRRWPWIVLGVLATLVLAAVLFDWDWVKGPIERKISASTGRHFEMAHLDVKYRWPPRIVAQGVKFDNPEWAREPRMIEAEEISFTLAIPPLFRSEFVLPDVAMVAPVFALEINPKGTPNWMLHPDQPPDAEGQESMAPTVHRLTVDRGKVSFFDPANKTDLKVDISNQGTDAKDVLKLVAKGKYRGLESGAEAGGGGVLTLMRTEQAYPFKAEFHAGATKGSAEGTVTGLTELKAANLQIAIAGDSMADLYPLLSLSLPGTPPYKLKGRLLLEGGVWKLHDFDGRVGDSDLGGDVDIAYTNKRPNIVANLHSNVVDLDDLAGFIGATPDAGPGETASPKQEKKAAAEEASPRMLPDDPIKLDKLKTMDADVKYVGKSIRNKKSPIDDLQAHLILKDGNLSFEPLNFGVAGGKIASQLQILAREKTLKVSTKTEVRNIQLSKLFPKNEALKTSVGVIGGRAEFKGTGNSLSQIAAHADGSMGLAARGGKLSNLIMEAVGLDAFEVLKFLFGGDKEVALRCAVADFDIKNGVATSRAFVVDTSDTNVHVDGQLNFQDESLDLKVHALPKDYSPLTLRAPLNATGTFKHPKVRPDAKILVRGTVATVLGALINPLLALLPLIETAPGKDEDCARLVAAVERNTKQSIAAKTTAAPARD